MHNHDNRYTDDGTVFGGAYLRARLANGGTCVSHGPTDQSFVSWLGPGLGTPVDGGPIQCEQLGGQTLGFAEDREVVVDHLIRAQSEPLRRAGSPRSRAEEPVEVLVALARLGQPRTMQTLNSMTADLVALAVLVRASVVPLDRLVEAVVALHLAADRQDEPRWVSQVNRVDVDEQVQRHQARLTGWRPIRRARLEALLRKSVASAHEAREEERERWREWFARHPTPSP